MRPGSFNSGLLKMVEGFVSKMLGELSSMLPCFLAIHVATMALLALKVISKKQITIPTFIPQCSNVCLSINAKVILLCDC